MKNCIWCFGEYKRGLTDKEIREYFKLEYGSKWYSKYRSWCKFASVQTCSEVDGNHIWYRCDIENFMRPKEERFWD